jgi:uncharacterized protein (DUF305 family)
MVRPTDNSQELGVEFKTKERAMHINIDKKTGILSGVIAVLIGVIIYLIGFQNNSTGLFGMNHSTMAGEQGSAGSRLHGSDKMFLEMMIPHHQQAVDISNLAISRSKNTELVALAEKIRDAQAAEIIQMKDWLAGGADGSMISHRTYHSMGYGMGGMLTESELNTLNSLSGSKFDFYWLKGMIVHHEGALHMVTMIKDSNRSEIRNFGVKIISVQTAEIKQMKKMLNRMGGLN